MFRTLSLATAKTAKQYVLNQQSRTAIMAIEQAVGPEAVKGWWPEQAKQRKNGGFGPKTAAQEALNKVYAEHFRGSPNWYKNSRKGKQLIAQQIEELVSGTIKLPNFPESYDIGEITLTEFKKGGASLKAQEEMRQWIKSVKESEVTKYPHHSRVSHISSSSSLPSR